MQEMMNAVWHPCTPMKIHEKIPLLPVVGASGPYYYLKDGRRVFDAISSWWCKSLGHGHPRLKAVLMNQMAQFEHVMLAGTTNEVIMSLSEQLTTLLPGFSKVFYAGDGSSAVEIALKMSLHYRKRKGEQRHHFLSLENAYHGETAGAMSVSDLGLYRAPYDALLFDAFVLRDLPYVSGQQDILWLDAKTHFEAKLPWLESIASQLTALIIEPIVQGAGGMKIISADFLNRLMAWAHEHDIHIIADEIMTGFGRTGKMFAVDYLNQKPDFLCISKGMTSGWLAMSAVLTTQTIYDVLYTQHYHEAFLHSHTYSGNALAAAVALETLCIFKDENIVANANRMNELMLTHLKNIHDDLNCFENIRGIGGIAAAELREACGVLNFKEAMMIHAPQCGVNLRPLGNTLYWLPPLNSTSQDLAVLSETTQQSLLRVLRA